MRKESGHRGPNDGNHLTGRNQRSRNSGGAKPKLRRTRSPEAAPPAASPPEDNKKAAQLLLDHYAGDAAAYEEFVTMLTPWMHAQVRKFGRRVDPDEVVQRVLVRIYRQARHVQQLEHEQHHHSTHAHAGRGADVPACVDTHGEVKTNGWYDPAKGSVKAWLYVTLWREAISQIRHSSRQVSFDETAHGGTHQDFVIEEMVVREQLSGLPDRVKRAVEEREAGSTYEQIAAKLHCSIGTIHNYLHRLKN